MVVSDQFPLCLPPGRQLSLSAQLDQPLGYCLSASGRSAAIWTEGIFMRYVLPPYVAGRRFILEHAI